MQVWFLENQAGPSGHPSPLWPAGLGSPDPDLPSSGSQPPHVAVAAQKANPESSLISTKITLKILPEVKLLVVTMGNTKGMRKLRGDRKNIS